jgi:hypothetical protein
VTDEEERAAVVAWLRDPDTIYPKPGWHLDKRSYADMIEQGEHHRARYPMKHVCGPLCALVGCG